MTAPKLLSADVECGLSRAQPNGGLLVLPALIRCGGEGSAAEGPLLSVVEACFGDFGGITSAGDPRSTQSYGSIHDPWRAPNPAQLSVTPCRVISRVSHRKQTIDTLTKCHTFSCPPRAISWPVRRAFRIISAPISPKEPRVQGR